MKVTFKSLLESKSKFPIDFLNLTDTCIIWPRYKNKLGYGQFRYKNNGINYNCLAHRASYAYYNNEMPGKDDVVMHFCDNPSCINPLHLKKGTHMDNVKDRHKKGRSKHGVMFGKDNPMYKHGRYSKKRNPTVSS